MAYNVLKGSVQFINSDSGSIESMVDDHSDQTIGGIKTFSSAITASGGISSTTYSATSVNSTSGSFAELTISSSTTHTPLLILDKAESSSSFVEFRKEGTKYAEISTNEYETLYIKTDATSYPIFFRQAAKTPLKFQSSMATFQSYPVHVSQSLHVTGSSFINNLSASNEISASAFYGSGQGLTNIPASGLNLGDSTDNSSGNLIVKLSSSGGLESTVNGLRTNPSLAIEKTSPVNTDKFLLSDSAAGNVPKYLTYQNLAAGVTSGITTYPPNGNNGAVQIKNGSAFLGPNQLSFDTTANTLTVTGQLTASVHVSSSQVFATSFYGDGSNLTNLPATQLSGNIVASKISIGDGLFNDSGFVAVSASYGLTASANGLEVTASSVSGLDVNPTIGGIAISPSRTTAKASPITGDVILIGDSADSNRVKNTALTNVVTLVTNNGAAGLNTQVQFNSSNAFAGDNSFTFNSATNTLAVQEISSSGNISASFFYGDGSNLQNVGGQSAFTIFSSSFTISSSYDVLGINTSGSVVTGSLLAASSYSAGQRLVFKDIAGSASVNNIVVEVSGTQQLDGVSGASLKITANNGSATIVSDGVSNFYIIGTN